MRKIKVMIVDDSVVVRRLIGDSLKVDPEIEVVGIASNGNLALKKIPQLKPDLVTLDIEMPEMNGLETLAEIRKIYPRLPVIMFSTLTERGGTATLEALALGASDYVTKPANVGSVSEGMKRVQNELIPKIKAFCSGTVGLPSPQTIIPPSPDREPLKKSATQPHVSTPINTTGQKTPVLRTGTIKQKIEIVAIGVSTGGPNALAELFPVFPSDFPVPIVMVQHMPPFFTKLLAERLDSKSNLKVYEGQTDMQLKRGEALVAPGNYHMVVKQKGQGPVVQLNQDEPENSCRPAVDVLFRSVCEVYGKNVLGVILTGMGHDGLNGCEHITKAGGQVLVQDEASSVVWGMPGFVARAGLADGIHPLNKIGYEIIERVKAFR